MNGLPDPTRLVQLLEEAGWRRTGGRDGVYSRFRPPEAEFGFKQRSLLIPLDTSAPEFDEVMQEALSYLRFLPSDSAAYTLLSRLTTSPTDQFAFAKETSAPKGWIQWEEGESLISSVRGLLVAGAKTARENLTYFGNRYGQFANRFMEEVMMGQTAVSSYVVTAYVPTAAPIPLRKNKDSEEGVHFIGQDAISSRDVSKSVATTLDATTEALSHFAKYNNLSVFTEPELALSYESVSALQKMTQDADYASITIKWEPSLVDILEYEQEFSFRGSQAPTLARAANELVKPEPTKPESAVGTVHLLSRSESGGPGVIGITTLDGQPAKKLRVHLEEDDYHRALSAHDRGSIVRVAGNLEREGNLSWLYQARILQVIDAQESQSTEAGDDQSSLF